MDFKKERNFIVAYDGSNNILGKWNILTGDFIGKGGKQVKSCPSCFTYQYLTWDFNKNILSASINFYRQWPNNYTTKRGQRFEEMISVGLHPDSIHDLDSTEKLTKDLVNYIKKNYNGRYAQNAVNKYKIEKELGKFLEDKPEWYKSIIFNSDNSIPTDFKIAFLNRCESEKVINFFDAIASYNRISYIMSLMANYYEKCLEMYGEVKLKPNILTNYGHICALYIEYQNAHLNERIEKNNNKQFLNFQFGDFFARPLLTREDFHKEGEAQSNCVERLYMEKVANGQTYIVIVRANNAPEKSLVTCEVDLRGNIRQYLGFANSTVTNEALREFRREYSKHLSETVPC